MAKKEITIQERDWMNHEKRQMRGFINRERERFAKRNAKRNAKRYARKNNRKNTNGRKNQYVPVGQATKLIRHTY